MTDRQLFVVPYDFSAHSRAALATALDLGAKLGADLQLVHVLQAPIFAYGPFGGGTVTMPPIQLAEAREGAQKSLAAVAEDIADFPGRVEPVVTDGLSIADAVCRTASEHGADLIVMGTHGRTGFAHVFLGSVAERTLRSAPCPVLTVRAEAEDASAQESG